MEGGPAADAVGQQYAAEKGQDRGQIGHGPDHLPLSQI